MPDPLLSIVITTKNSLGVVEPLVEALLSQKLDHDYEVLFMDNDSSDGTRDYLKSLPLDRKRILHVPEGEFSHSGTRNRAARAARGEIVLFFTDDILPIGRYFIRDLAAPLLSGTVDAAYGVYQIDPQRHDPIDAWLHNHWYEQYPAINLPLEPGEWEALEPADRRQRANFDNCCSCIRRSVLLEQPFPDVPYGEDMFFASRLLTGGHATCLVKNARFYHWHHMTFRYFLKRMVIDQHLSLPEFGIRYVKNKWRLFRGVAVRVLHRTLVGLFRLRIPLGRRLYWIAYNCKILTADFLGKYIGGLSARELEKPFAPVNKRLYRLKEKLVEEVYQRSIIRS